jgi:prolyl-tRNA editing enzyme YbaK/EbsC (Cys-tRNA(Pro) deacylase)
MGMKRSAAAVQEALDQHGVECHVVELPASTRSASDAAAAIGCTVAEIAKSIVFRKAGTEEAVLVIVSGADRVDEEKLATLIGCPIEKADADFVRRATGFAIGGVPPFAHRHRIHTWIDAGLFQFSEIWAAAGTPNAVFRLTPGELERISGGSPAMITKQL